MYVIIVSYGKIVYYFFIRNKYMYCQYVEWNVSEHRLSFTNYMYVRMNYKNYLRERLRVILRV